MIARIKQKLLAKLLKENNRQVDSVARYRLGGEEFTIILPATDQEAAYSVAAQMLTKIRELKVGFNNSQLSITVNIGVASYHRKQSQQELISQADQALYHAKNKGKDQIAVN